MILLVDTSVWSLALRRDVEATTPEIRALKEALLGSDTVVTTGIVLQELLQGFAGPHEFGDGIGGGHVVRFLFRRWARHSAPVAQR